jgi:hypothetical protein
VELLLFALALLLLLVAGGGAVWLIAPRGRKVSVVEGLSLALPVGAMIVSLASFGLGFWLSGKALRWAVGALCLALAVAGIVRKQPAAMKLSWPRPAGRGDYLLLGVLLIQISFIVWLSLRTTLGWDGLLVWEIKAHLACLSGGVIPPRYFSDPSRIWTHPEYPLWLPLTESWFYGWLGECHQGLVKLIFPLLYLAAAGLLYTSGARIGGQRRQGWLAALLLFFIPLVLVREGSLTSGYADFPLAVCYLAAVIQVAEYWRTGAVDALRWMGASSAALPWIKQEGAILWLCLVVLVAIKAVPRKQAGALLLAALPGAVVLAGWMIFVRVMKAPAGQDYLPFDFSTLWSNLDRAPVIFQAVLRESVNWRNWGLLWPAMLLALPVLKVKRYRQPVVVLWCAVLLPAMCYLGPFFFIKVGGKTLSDHLDV